MSQEVSFVGATDVQYMTSTLVLQDWSGTWIDDLWGRPKVQ